MSYNDTFKKITDKTYELVKRKVPDIRFPCYGVRFYTFALLLYNEYVHFYLTSDSIIYTASSVYLTEIPFAQIKKLSIKQGKFFKRAYDIRLVADKKYHFQISGHKNFSTDLTGDSMENVRNFIETLQAGVGNNNA